MTPTDDNRPQAGSERRVTSEEALKWAWAEMVIGVKVSGGNNEARDLLAHGYDAGLAAAGRVATEKDATIAELRQKVERLEEELAIYKLAHTLNTVNKP